MTRHKTLPCYSPTTPSIFPQCLASDLGAQPPMTSISRIAMAWDTFGPPPQPYRFNSVPGTHARLFLPVSVMGFWETHGAVSVPCLLRATQRYGNLIAPRSLVHVRMSLGRLKLFESLTKWIFDHLQIVTNGSLNILPELSIHQIKDPRCYDLNYSSKTRFLNLKTPSGTGVGFYPNSVVPVSYPSPKTDLTQHT